MNTINYYYTPQKRERVIFIGNRKGLKNYHPKPNETYIGYDLASAAPATIEDIDIKNAIIKGIGNRTVDSYFTTLKELFNL